MKELEFEFDDEIFEESNCRTNRVQGTYKPKLCDPEVCLKAAIPSFMKALVLSELLLLLKVSPFCQEQ